MAKKMGYCGYPLFYINIQTNPFQLRNPLLLSNSFGMHFGTCVALQLSVFGVHVSQSQRIGLREHLQETIVYYRHHWPRRSVSCKFFLSLTQISRPSDSQASPPVATSQWFRGALLPRTTGRLRLLQQQQLQEQEQDLRSSQKHWNWVITIITTSHMGVDWVIKHIKPSEIQSHHTIGTAREDL